MKRFKGKGSVRPFLLIAVAAFLSMPLTVFAQDTHLTTTVPPQFLLKIEMNGKGEVHIGEKHFSKTAIISVDRHTVTTITVAPAAHYQIESIVYNGEILAEGLPNNILTLSELTGNSVLSITFSKNASLPQTGGRRLPILLYVSLFFSFLIMCIWVLAAKRNRCS